MIAGQSSAGRGKAAGFGMVAARRGRAAGFGIAAVHRDMSVRRDKAVPGSDTARRGRTAGPGIADTFPVRQILYRNINKEL